MRRPTTHIRMNQIKYPSQFAGKRGFGKLSHRTSSACIKVISTEIWHTCSDLLQFPQGSMIHVPHPAVSNLTQLWTASSAAGTTTQCQKGLKCKLVHLCMVYTNTLAESAGAPLGYISTCPLLNNILYPLSSNAETNMRFFLIPDTYRTSDTFKGGLGSLLYAKVPTLTALTTLSSPSTISISVPFFEIYEKY